MSVHVFKMSTTSTHTRSQRITPLVNRSIDDDLVKAKPSLRQAFSQVVDVVNLFRRLRITRNVEVEFSKYLGVYIDSDLSWQHHIDFIYNKKINSPVSFTRYEIC